MAWLRWGEHDKRKQMGCYNQFWIVCTKRGTGKKCWHQSLAPKYGAWKKKISVPTFSDVVHRCNHDWPFSLGNTIPHPNKNQGESDNTEDVKPVQHAPQCTSAQSSRHFDVTSDVSDGARHRSQRGSRSIAALLRPFWRNKWRRRCRISHPSVTCAFERLCRETPSTSMSSDLRACWGKV